MGMYWSPGDGSILRALGWVSAVLSKGARIPLPLDAAELGSNTFNSQLPSWNSPFLQSTYLKVMVDLAVPQASRCMGVGS